MVRILSDGPEPKDTFNPYNPLEQEFRLLKSGYNLGMIMVAPFLAVCWLVTKLAGAAAKKANSKMPPSDSQNPPAGVSQISEQMEYPEQSQRQLSEPGEAPDVGRSFVDYEDE